MRINSLHDGDDLQYDSGIARLDFAFVSTILYLYPILYLKMTENKLKVLPIKTVHNKQDLLVSNLKDELNKARTDALHTARRQLADRQKEADELMDKVHDYVERFTKKLDRNEKALETVTQNIEEHRRKLLETVSDRFIKFYKYK